MTYTQELKSIISHLALRGKIARDHTGSCGDNAREQLVTKRRCLYIDGMNVAFDIPEAQAERLQREADRLGISPSELARAALTDLLANPDETFQTASDRVLQKNAELYRRLA
jgi:hypothetical protein